MNIVVIGNANNLEECSQKFGENHSYSFVKHISQAEKILTDDHVAFDFQIADRPNKVDAYRGFSGVAFLDVSRCSLSEIVGLKSRTNFFGFCGMPTFLNRDLLEISISKQDDKRMLEEVCEKLDTKFAVVKDQVGLITPRVICMIINEAYFAIQEKIASREDIDLAMKLGTNYPFGPFEWCKRIGIKNVFELLSTVHKTTKDDRYQVCELLKKEAFN
jgi:3-hydroxybutyryl-CoA dehydrogenase